MKLDGTFDLNTMRLEEAPDLSGGGTGVVDPVIPAAEAAPVADAAIPDAVHPDGTEPAAVVSPEDEMWGDLKPDEPAALDPNAKPEIPAEFQQALALSEFVKEPAQMAQAVRAADELWKVESGQVPVHAMLEGFRARNAAGFEKILTEGLIPYVEAITGKKLGGTGEAAAPDPVAEMQAQLRELQERPAREAAEREQREYVQRAETAGGAKLTELIAAGNGIFEGDAQAATQAVAAQFAKMGINPQVAMREVLAGNTANLEKAYKAAEKAKTLEVKAYADRIRARYTKLKGAVPASKGGGSVAALPASGEADMSTQAGRAKWMAQQFAAGEGGS